MAQIEKDEERPDFVKSTNFRHSTNMKFPEEPPTDRQVKYAKFLISQIIYQVKNGKHEDIDKSILNFDIPKTRKEMSEIIQKLISINEDAKN